MKNKPNFVKDLIILTNCLETIDLDDCDEDVIRPALGDALVSLQDLIIEKDPTAFQLFKSLTNENKIKKPETEIEALNETISYFNQIFKDDYEIQIQIQNVVYLAEQLKECLSIEEFKK